MKRTFCLLICLTTFSLLNVGSAEQLPYKDKLYTREIEDTYWYAKGGKIELKEGFWHFDVKQKISNTGAGKRVEDEHFCFCIFTVMNNSNATYKINPSISLLGYYRDTLYRIPPAEYFGVSTEHAAFRKFYDRRRSFKPRVLRPGEGYTFEDEFSVSQEVLLKTAKLKLDLAITEIEEE